MTRPLPPLSRTATLLFLFGAGLYVVASFFPNGPAWGMNLLGYYSDTGRATLIALALVLGLPAAALAWVRIAEKTLSAAAATNRTLGIVAALSALAATLFFYHFRIATDIYGDTRTLLSYLGEHQYTLGEVFAPHDTEPLTRLIHQMVAQTFHIELAKTFQLVSSACGGIFIALLFLFVAKQKGPMVWKVAVFLMGLTTGANQLFFGHVEDYTLVYLAMYVVLGLVWLSFEGRNVSGLLTAAFIVGIMLHAEMVLYLPAFAYLVAYRFRERVPSIKPWLEPRVLLRVVGASLIVAFAFYLFYFHAYRYEVGDYIEILKKIFLPMVNYQPEPHSYSMLSWKHLSDVLQETIMTVSPCAFLLLIAALLHGQRVRWNQPAILFYALGSIYFMVFNLTVNPLLSMLRDWDFLSLASVPLTFLAAAVSREFFETAEDVPGLRRLVAAGAALAVFSCSLFFVNSHHDRVQRRLEGVGTWAYHSYFAGSSYIINVAQKMIPDPSEQLRRREEMIASLEPYRSRPDGELGVLYFKLAETAVATRDFAKAELNFSMAYGEDSANASAFRGLAFTALVQHQYERAEILLDAYNASVNRPEVADFLTLTLAQRVASIREIEFTGGDPAAIRKELDEAYRDYRDR